MSSRTPGTEDDNFVPSPVWFAYQLGWCNGPQGQWSWSRVLDQAERLYWSRKPAVIEERSRAV